MRSKRTIKPTKIIDNCVTNSSRNSSKQKNVSKNSKNSSSNMKGTMEYEEDTSSKQSNDVNMGREEVVDGNVVESIVEDVDGSVKRMPAESENGNGIADDGLKECDKESVLVGNDNDKVNSDLNDVTMDNDVTNNDNSKNSVENKSQNTYAGKLNANNNIDGNKLFFVPTCTKTNGEEELKYNIRRMWGRLGLKDIVVDADEMCFFKFKSEEQMNHVVDQSLWIINGKPMIVQKWEPETVIVKESPWMPVKMDHMTAEICKEGSGRLGYARVLVEIDANKEYVDKVEIDYVNSNMNVKSTKWVKVEYSWKPAMCSHYGVFGHTINNCNSKPKVNVEVEQGSKPNEKGENNIEGFVEVRN
ncbi:RNA-directed DNA polymerase, eukaryota, reverse transcriptase zinc-binding domain protein [Tanacetum coccineum]